MGWGVVGSPGETLAAPRSCSLPAGTPLPVSQLPVNWLPVGFHQAPWRLQNGRKGEQVHLSPSRCVLDGLPASAVSLPWLLPLTVLLPRGTVASFCCLTAPTQSLRLLRVRTQVPDIHPPPSTIREVSAYLLGHRCLAESEFQQLTSSL